MNEHDRPPLKHLQDEAAALGADLREMLALRWELARRELMADVQGFRRLVLRVTVATVMALTALPLLVVAAAWWLDGWLGISAAAWLAGVGLVLLAAAAMIALLAWRLFRRRFIGLTETLEELHEDFVWLKEFQS